MDTEIYILLTDIYVRLEATNTILEEILACLQVMQGIMLISVVLGGTIMVSMLFYTFVKSVIGR